MLSELFCRFIQESAATVMARAVLERLLPPEQLDAWFERTAERQYTRELLFSSVFGLMLEVVCGIRASVHAAYQALAHTFPVSVVSVYHKLNGLEPATSAALVRYVAQEASALIRELGGARPALLPGYEVRILDGNCLAASERRVKELRALRSAPLPGKSLVVYDPSLDVMLDVLPCEDGYTQERALLAEVLPRVSAGELWIADRNFCVLAFLLGLDARGAFFIIREHEQFRFRPLGPMRAVGESDTGVVAEQPIEVLDAAGEAVGLRRIRVRLKTPTREGESEIYLLTNLPAEVEALIVAGLYRKRWTLETAFQALEAHFHSEINTLGYPKAALLGFCIAVVAYNVWAVVQAALRRVHGVEKVEHEVSGYYLAEEMSATYRGMMIALPPPEWAVFQTLSLAAMAACLLDLAQHVRLSAVRKHRRGPKKPASKLPYDPKHPHVSTARLIAQRKKKSKAGTSP
jgi:IS4 transposase